MIEVASALLFHGVVLRDGIAGKPVQNIVSFSEIESSRILA